MLHKLRRLKKCGIFRDWTWAAELEGFRKFNVVYGHNGSGKTTLGKIFALAARDLESRKLNGWEYSLEFSGGQTREQSQPEANQNIKVFNQDFVAENISWTSNKTKPIVGIGKDAIDAKKAIDELSEKLKALRSELDQKKTQHQEAEDSLGALLRKEAQSLKVSVGFQSGDTRFGNYNRTRLEEALLNFDKDGFVELNDQELQIKYAALKDTPKPSLALQDQWDSLESRLVRLLGGEGVTLAKYIDDAVGRSVVSESIARLKDSPKLEAWVREGVVLHSHDKESCKFCGSRLSDEFWRILEKHFSEDYEKSVARCQSIADALVLVSPDVTSLPRPSDFYADLSEEAQSFIERLVQISKTFLSPLSELRSLLEGKIADPSQVFDGSMASENLLNAFGLWVDSVRALNRVITKHNKKSEDFAQEQGLLRADIERQAVGKIYSEVQALKKKMHALNLEIGQDGTLVKQIKDVSEAISDKQKQVGRYSVKLFAFNSMLHGFLGRQEITLRLREGDDSGTYEILRGDEYADNLSEGEKSAIALIYFLTKLREDGCNLSECIVVVDDPVSSLDASFLFNGFCFLRAQLEGAKQIFVLTHNFQFLRLVLRWLDEKNKRADQDNRLKSAKGAPLKDRPAMFYMLESEKNGEGLRSAKLSHLDPFLLRYSSEYEYLYAKLKKFQTKKSGSWADFYEVPHIARKVLESFLAYAIPGNLELWDKIDQVKEIAPEIRMRIFTFVNFHSHGGGDRVEEVDITLLAETPQVLDQVFLLMMAVNDVHCRRMDDWCGISA